MATELLENPVIQVSGTATIEPNVEVANLCEVRESQVVTTSLRVAEIFSKQHKHVLEAIRNLDCSDGFRGSNFRLTLKDKELHGSVARQDPFYFITRDGFIFLVMGFTGKTAAKYKEAYIYAFNEMEAKLRRQQEEERMLRRMQGRTLTGIDMPRVVSESLARTGDIVESYGKQRVVSSVTLARLMGKEHRYVCDSVRRMFKHVLRPNRLFIRVTRTVRKGYGQGYDSDTGIMYFITIEGFQTMRTHCTGLPDDVAAEVITAFHRAKGKNRPGQPNAVTPKPTSPKAEKAAKPEKPTAAPTLPKTPADMMQRFMKAMGVMMGMDVNDINNLINGGNE